LPTPKIGKIVPLPTTIRTTGIPSTRHRHAESEPNNLSRNGTEEKGREGKRREEKGREGKGREWQGREGKDLGI
jgi:hypothetical protein